MTDLAEFSQPNFEAKAWINKACASRNQDETLEKFLAELEMKLQLTSEDVEAALEANSDRILNRLPSAVQEIQRVKADVKALQSETQRIYDQLDASQRKASASVAPLSSLDAVKTRMEGTCNTLRQASELSTLFSTVEEVFAAGDLPKAAEVLSTMRRSLSTVGDVPEFRNGWSDLQSLENRLQNMVEGPLSGALTHKKGDMVRQLVSILMAIDRRAVVEKQFITARMAPLLKFWEGFDKQGSNPQGFSQWLPRFYDEVLLSVEGEARWCQAVLPDLHPGLVLAMLDALFSRVKGGFDRRLKASVEPAGAVEAFSLGEAMSCQGACRQFARGLLSTVGHLSDEQAGSLVGAVMSPFQPLLARYGEFESAAIGAQLSGFDPDEVTRSGELDSIVSAMVNSVPHAVLAVEQALERCVKYTKGCEIGSLLRVADDALSQFCGRLSAAIRALRPRCIPDSKQAQPGTKGSDSAAGRDAWDDAVSKHSAEDAGPAEDVGTVVQLLTMASNLVGKLSVLEAQMQNAVSEAVSLVDQQNGAGSASLRLTAADISGDPVLVAISQRLAMDPRVGSGLRALLSQLQDQRYNSLPGSTQRALAVQQMVESLVYDALMHKVEVQMRNIADLPNWAEEAGENAFNLPAFSSYPLGYVSTVGEYLMTLPQQLESWMAQEDEDDELLQADADWLDKVATGSAELYTKKLLAIPKLSEKGAQQLSADLEYFCNVLSALSVAVPLTLTTIQVAVSLPSSDFAASAADALQQQELERRTLEHVAEARGLSL